MWASLVELGPVFEKMIWQDIFSNLWFAAQAVDPNPINSTAASIRMMISSDLHQNNEVWRYVKVKFWTPSGPLILLEHKKTHRKIC